MVSMVFNGVLRLSASRMGFSWVSSCRKYGDAWDIWVIVMGKTSINKPEYFMGIQWDIMGYSSPTWYDILVSSWHSLISPVPASSGKWGLQPSILVLIGLSLCPMIFRFGSRTITERTSNCQVPQRMKKTDTQVMLVYVTPSNYSCFSAINPA